MIDWHEKIIDVECDGKAEGCRAALLSCSPYPERGGRVIVDVNSSRWTKFSAGDYSPIRQRLLSSVKQITTERPPPTRAKKCIHLGEQIGEQQCKACGGTIRAKIFQCALHGPCSPFTKQLEGVRRCGGCGDYCVG